MVDEKRKVEGGRERNALLKNYCNNVIPCPNTLNLDNTRAFLFDSLNNLKLHPRAHLTVCEQPKDGLILSGNHGGARKGVSVRCQLPHFSPRRQSVPRVAPRGLASTFSRIIRLFRGQRSLSVTPRIASDSRARRKLSSPRVCQGSHGCFLFAQDAY